MGKAAHIAEQNAKRMEAAFKSASVALGTIGAALSVGAFAAMVKGVADTGDQLQKMSVKTGIAVEELSKLQYAASLSDVSNEDLSSSLSRLNKVLGEAADGSKEATAALARFGIAPGAMNASEAFVQIAERVKNTGDSAKVASGLTDIFGKSYANLIPLLKGGAEGLKESGDELERMGGVMSGDLAKSAEAFNDNVTRLNTQLEALRIQTLGPLIPLFEEITKAMSDSSDKANDLAGSGGALKTAFEAVAVLGANVAYVFKQVGNEIGGIAAQATFLAKGDFNGVSAIREMMVADAVKAREEIDALSEKLLSTSKKITEITGFGGRSRITSFGPEISGTPATAKAKTTKTGKTDDPLASFISDLEARIKPAEQALDSFRQMQLDAAVAGADLTAAEKKFYDLINSPEWQTMGEPWKELVTQQFEAANATQKAADEQQRLNNLLASLESSKIEQAWQDMELLNKALANGKISQEQYSEATNRLFDGGTEKLKEQKSLAEELGMTFTSAFEDAIVKGEEFSDVLDGLAQDILRIMMRKNVTEPLTNALGAVNWGSLLSLNAKGNVYSSPSLSAYSGGVYDSPRLFKFASGAGVFGEAGPEAIMPLSRTSDGKLGVKAQGAGNVSITINNSMSDQAQVTAQPRMNNGQLEIEVLVQRALANDMSRNGPITQGLSNTFGMRRNA